MLYLLFALTFLTGILFYGMSPRDDKLHLDTHQAEGMVVSFLNQHQAARDYLYAWMGVNDYSKSDSNVLQGNTKNFLKATTNGNGGVFDFSAWLASGVTNDICLDNVVMNRGDPGLSGQPDSCFVSRVICANNSGTLMSNCAHADVRKRYVVTYGGWVGCDTEAGCVRPRWWPAESVRVRRFEQWRKAISKRTRGSVSCGTLYENPSKHGEWCIDNGETVFKSEIEIKKRCVNPVPSAVIDALPYNDIQKDDLLICFSKVNQDLSNYVSGLSHFYDGYSNIDFGRHTDANVGVGGGDAKWVDLAGSNNILNISWNQDRIKPHLTLSAATQTRLNTGITLNSPFTLTVLVDTPSGSGTGATLLGWANDSVKIFEKESDNGSDVFTLNKINANPDDPVKESACNNKPAQLQPTDAVTENRILSWTFVVDDCKNSAGQCITVYENAARHDGGVISGPIQNPNGQTLILSTTGGTTKVYGIRYYNRALRPAEIQQNFKVDQKRFGIADFNNGESKSCVVVQGAPCACTNINAGGA